MVVRASGPGVLFAAAFVGFVLAGAAAGHAQTPAASPVPQPRSITGFVPTYEIMRTVRAAGLQPLEPPLREGRTYVLRATDYRGILMHVVLDARTGAIRDVTQIVGPYGYGMMPPPYGPPPYDPSRAADAAPYGPPRYDRAYAPPGIAPPMRNPAARAQVPPLPRPRPAPPKSETAAKPADDAANAAGAAAKSPPPASKTEPIAPFND